MWQIEGDLLSGEQTESDPENIPLPVYLLMAHYGEGI